MNAPLDSKPASEQTLLYQSAAKIYPRQVSGRYARLRVVAMFALLGAYYLVPWLSLNGEPLVWLDLPHRRFHVLWMTLVPQDLILLTGLLLTAALTLFFFTTLGGRLWCGYACPQTVWTEAFLWMEHFAEGDRHARMKLDAAPWSANKILRRGTKHLLWLAFAMWTGFTFVAYFVPARELFGDVAQLQLSGWPLFWGLFYGFATWGNAGFLREQVCKYMCPYARFQSAMFDRDTLIIAYDEKRGEPRKSVAKKVGLNAGDCIDCSLCVQVCPTGIDIRKGLQYECIACAACVDACNGVMDAVKKPRGLIHYTSSNHEAGKPYHLLRPRAIGYGVIWLLVCAALAVAVLIRSPLHFDVLRDRHTLYRERVDGSIENVYQLKVTNEDDVAHRFHISAVTDDGQVLTVVPETLTRDAGQTAATTVTLGLPAAMRDEIGSDETILRIHVRLQSEDKASMARTRAARFLTGDPHAQ